jgi:hypothetical protein
LALLMSIPSTSFTSLLLFIGVSRPFARFVHQAISGVELSL